MKHLPLAVIVTAGGDAVTDFLTPRATARESDPWESDLRQGEPQVRWCSGERMRTRYCWSIQRVPVVHHGGVRFSLGP